MKYKAPKFKSESFNCPRCGAYSHMTWYRLFRGQSVTFPGSSYWEAQCACCKGFNLWLETDERRDMGELLYPDHGSIELPEDDMPSEVISDYREAASIITRSRRGAAALFRLGLQKLCVHLGEKGQDINEDIRALASKNKLPPEIIQVADTVRLTGNAAVHPSQMLPEDIDDVASQMGSLINYIVRRAITDPKKIQELYNKTPKSKREAAENADSRAKEKKE